MKRILLIGGTGFVGQALAHRLARADGDAAAPVLVLPTRHRDRARSLCVLPTANVVEADVHDPQTLRDLMAGCDAVINLVGILHGGEARAAEHYGAGFARAHVELPCKIAEAAHQAHVRRVLHVSALGAAIGAPSGYLRSKAAGEAALITSGLDLTIVRPSVIFGRGDAFMTLFAELAAVAPVFPLAGADVRFAPVWVEDVVTVLVESLRRSGSIGEIYPLCGPREYRLRELVAYAAELGGHPRKVIGLPGPLAWMQARAMELLPDPPMTRDNLRSMKVPSVCPAGCTLPFDLVATPLEAIAPGYLKPRH